LIDKKIKQLLSVNLDDENEVEKTLMTLSDNANDYQKINHLEESEILERKSSLRYDTKSKNYQNYITDSALKTIVAFLNTNGGDLVIGVDDDKNLLGIEIDKFKNADAWTIYLKDKIKTNIGLSFLKEKIKISTLEIQDKTIGLITCKKLDGGEKAFLNGTDFYVRTGPATEKLSVKDAFEWDKQRKN
jgi:predicted HTH transcriptional regulator